MNIVFFGTSEFAVPILEKLSAGQWRPDIVVTAPDASAGRGLAPKPPRVKIAAERLGLPVIQPEKSEIGNLKLEIGAADLFIVAAYGMILPPELLKIPKRGSLNVHPSLLPRWRGPSPIQHSLLNGDAETGVTIMLMDEQADHGSILRNLKLETGKSKLNAPELSRRLAELGADLLLETIPGWIDGSITPAPQDDSQATYSKILKKEDGHIDWSRSAEAIERMTRAFSPWPGAYAFWKKNGDQVRLVIEAAEAPAISGQNRSMAGTAVELSGGFGVATGKGVLLVKRIKPAGGKSMAAEDFLRGRPEIIGSVLR